MERKKLKIMKRVIGLMLAAAMAFCPDTITFAGELAFGGGNTTAQDSMAQSAEAAQDQGQGQESVLSPAGQDIGQEEASIKMEESVTPVAPAMQATPATITLEESCVLLDIGQTVQLPSYTITGAAETANAVWTAGDAGIVRLDAEAGSILALKAGVTSLTLQLETDASVYAECKAVVRPSAPSTASVESVSYNAIGLRWAEASGADGYLIYRRSDRESEYTKLAELAGAAAASYLDDSGLLTGRNYTYRIFSYLGYEDGSGTAKYAESTEMAEVSAMPALGKAVIKGAAPKSATEAEISWEPLDGAEGYTVYRAAGSSASFVEAGNAAGSEVSYVDSGLTPGQSYRYKVKGYRAVEGSRVYGEESDAAAVTPAPAAPVLRATLPNYKTIKLSWGKVDGADGYAIYRKVSGNSSFQKVKTIKSGQTLSWKDKTVDPGTKYVYRIRAYQTVGGSKIWGDDSAELSVTATLSAPEASVSVLTYNSIQISWTKVSGAQGYQILRATGPGGKYKAIKNVSGNKTFTYSDTKLDVGTVYYYKVCAYRTVDGERINGMKSQAASQQAVPGEVKLTAEAAGLTAVKLVWEKVDLPAKKGGYYIYQRKDGELSRIATCKAKATSYTVEGLASGQEYTFQAVAYAKDGSGNVILGLGSNLLVAKPELATVTIEGAEPSEGGMLLSWVPTGTQEEDSYLIYRSASKKSGFKKIGTVERKDGTSEYTFEDGDVVIGRNYYYKIRCEKTLGDGTSIKSGYSAVVGALATPSAPSVTLENTDSTSVTISWKAITGSAGYYIYRSDTKNGKYRSIKKISDGLQASYTDVGLTLGQTYYYKVRAYTNTGSKIVYGPYSDGKSIRVVPEAPAIRAEAVDYTTVSVSWGKVEGCEGYQLYKSTSSDSGFKKVAKVASGTTSYEDKNATLGVTAFYKVRAYSTKDGKKIYGTFSDVEGMAPILNKPSGLKAELSGESQVKLTWNAVPGAETYTILRGTSPDGTFKIASEICSTNSFLDTNALAGKTYYYKLYAVRGEIRSEMSEYVAATPSGLSLNVTDVVIKTGNSVTVTATPTPAATVTWTSSNTAVATVTQGGVIYGVKAGTAKVYAIANGIQKTVNVTVKDQLD